MVVTWRGIGMFCHVLLCIVSCMASGVMFFSVFVAIMSVLSLHHRSIAPLVIVIDIIRMNTSISILIELH